MKKDQWLLTIALVSCAIALVLTCFDFLALHDIRNEYVSTRILKYLNVTLSDELPEWTATKGEWEIVNVSFLFRLAFFVLNLFVLSFCVKRFKRNSEASES